LKTLKKPLLHPIGVLIRYR